MGSGQSHQVQPHTGNSPEIKRWDTGQPRDSSQPTSSRRQAPPAPRDVKQYGVKSPDVSKAMSVASVSEDGNDYSIFEYVANSIVGKDVVLDGPFGHKKVLYLDYIASGRALTFIEDYITNEVLPHYANTHTSTSVTARQTTVFRNGARNIIRTTTNCNDDDAVIFCGNGVTGAVHKLIHALKFTEPPVVFTSPYEHHSNILPWREIHAEVIRIRQTPNGLIDLEHLEDELQHWATTGRRLIGSMSAASNVTGILSDVNSITVMLHTYGALALWDYATAGPYVRIDMNPVVSGKNQALVYKDAVFISPHKFVGGVSTPGLLLAKKKLFINEIPHNCGGGTVLFVIQTGHRYLRALEEREEGGTPAIVGAIRTGLVFQLKAAITPELIMDREQQLFRRARQAWGPLPNLLILGSMEVERLPVFSFLVRHPATGYYLHHNYVACLLNDLFGIQARGGCACAGPYAQDLLGINNEQAKVIEKLLTTEDESQKTASPADGHEDALREIFKPGFTRLNLPYFISEEQLDFVLQAVVMVTEHGWKLLPQYSFNIKTAEWKHKNSQESQLQKRLDQLSYTNGYLDYEAPGADTAIDLPETLQDTLQRACQTFQDAETKPWTVPDDTHVFEDFTRASRWFLLPSEANEIVRVLSQLSSLSGAKSIMNPQQTQVTSTCRPPAAAPPNARSSVTTSLASSGYDSGPSSNLPDFFANGNGKAKSKSKPAHVQKIRVKSFQKPGEQWVN